MELLLAFLILVALLGLLDYAAVKWGTTSINLYKSETKYEHRSNW